MIAIDQPGYSIVCKSVLCSIFVSLKSFQIKVKNKLSQANDYTGTTNYNHSPFKSKGRHFKNISKNTVMHIYYKTKISINESNEQSHLRRPPNLLFMPWFGAGNTASGTAATYPFSYDLSQCQKKKKKKKKKKKYTPSYYPKNCNEKIYTYRILQKLEPSCFLYF